MFTVQKERVSQKVASVFTKQIDPQNFVMNLSPDSSDAALEPVGGFPRKKQKKKKSEPEVIMVAPGHQELKVVMSKQSESGVSINLDILETSV